MSNLDRFREHNKKNKKQSNKLSSMKSLSSTALIAAMILTGVNDAYAQWIEGTTSQKQAIELLKSQGKLLPNVPTDYTHYGIRYPSGKFVYHTYPYANNRQRYEADNLKDVDGKNIEIDNDIDSCMFLNETVYKANLSKIVPIIIDGRIDTARCTRGEYTNVDRANSKDFTGEGIAVTGTAGTHMSMMANVLAAQKDNYTEEDLVNANYTRSGTGEDVGVRPGKTRLYSMKPYPTGDITAFEETFVYILNEAVSHPDENHILSCSRVGEIGNMAGLFDKLGLLSNVIIITGRNLPSLDDADMTYATHPATISVGFVITPDLKVIDTKTQKLSFAGSQKDRVVPSPDQSIQTGKMDGDAFCVLGERTTSQATAFMSGIVANLWNQNPSWTRDQIVAMLKRDVYKSSEYTYDANGFNERIGYGIAQPGRTMKENIIKGIMKEDLFSNQETSLNKKDGKFYFGTPNFWENGNGYTITGEGVSKDDKGYYIDLASVEPGNYNYTFWGYCTYADSVYTFPINRSVEIIGPESPIVEGLSGTYKWQNDDANTGKIWLKEFKGKFANYSTGTSVDIEFNGVKIENISVNLDGSFALMTLSDYPFPFTGNDVNLKITYIDAEGNQNSKDTKLPISVLTGREDISFPELKIYPNPVNNILNIDLPYGTENASVKIFNTSGQLHSTSNLTSDNNQIDLSSLKPGLYFVTVSDDKGNKKTEKIIKR